MFSRSLGGGIPGRRVSGATLAACAARALARPPPPPRSQARASTPIATIPSSRVMWTKRTRARRACPGVSESLVPAHRQADRGGDEADHAVRLDEIAPLLARPGIDVLGEQTVPVAAGEHVLEQGARLLPFSQRRQRVDVPEGAHQKGVLGLPEIVRLDIAEHEVAATELAPDGANRAHEAGIVLRDEAQLAQAEQARIERVAAPHRPDGGREAAPPGAPAPLAHELMYALRVAAPIGGAVGQAEMRRDSRQPVATGPAHHTGEGVDARRPPQLPNAGVRLVEQLGRLLA